MAMISPLFAKILAVSFGLFLLLAAPATVLADLDGGQGNGNDGNDASDNGNGNQWKDESGYLNSNDNNDDKEKERKNRMLNESAGSYFFGRFSLTDGVADGKFITFALNGSSGNVTDFALRNGVGDFAVFDSIQILGFAPEAVSVQGSVLFMLNDTVQVVMHDNPTGMIHIITNGSVAVSFRLAEGVDATALSGDEDDDAVRAVSISGNGLSGVIVTEEGDFGIDPTEMGVYVNVTLSDDHLVFRAHPVFSNHQMSDEAILDAISEGRVAGEISVMMREGLVSFDTMEYRGGFNLRLMSAARNRIMLQVEDQDHAGKIVILNVDQGTFDASLGELRVELDGVAVRSTANPLEVLYAEGSDASDAVYCLMQSNGTNQLLVYVPSFSVHELSISSLGPLDALLTLTGAAALLSAIAVVGVAALALRKRR